MTGRASRDKGYTLVELMIVVAIGGMLVGLAAWRFDATLPRWRTDALAREIALDLRSGLAIAARTNAPVTFAVDLEATATCPGASYRLLGADGTLYDTVCLANEYPGVLVSAAGADAKGQLGCGLALDLTARLADRAIARRSRPSRASRLWSRASTAASSGRRSARESSITSWARWRSVSIIVPSR